MNTQTFFAIMQRDFKVLLKEFDEFVIRVAVQPTLFVLVFGLVLPKIGEIPQGYINLIAPGILGMSMLTAGVFSTAIPLAWDFGATREIEDRLFAPISVRAVLLEKIVMGMIQAWLAGGIVFPIIYLFTRQNLNIQVQSYFFLLLILFLTGIISALFGMVLGTTFEPIKFSLMFSFIVIPMIFLGAAYYSWDSLKAIPWLKWVTLVNPLLYVNEGFRAILTPQISHIRLEYSLIGLIVSSIVFTIMAIKGFERRVYN
ncbi:MAG: ABC transporter permease [Actinobacteria bacterium]|nr:ABC transporter permease [Actinomycetota bacterium]